MGIVQSAQMYQDYSQYAERKLIEEECIEIDSRVLNMNLVSTLREDLRDLCSQQYSQIDTLMLISTLVMTFAFGFVVEGTFPDIEEFGKEKFEMIMCLYAIFMGLSIALPFWSVWWCLMCKNNLDDFLQRVLIDDTEKRLDVKLWIKNYLQFSVYWSENCQWYYIAAYNSFWLG
eukprot:UN28973